MTATQPSELAELIEKLRERTAFRYAGNCQCGKCQLVLREDLDAAIVALRAAVAPAPQPLSSDIAWGKPHVEYSASRGQSRVTYWVSREDGEMISRLSALPAQAMREAVSPRLGGIGVDWWAESVKLYRANKKLRKALQQQHDWHLAQGDKDFGDGITLNMADEYGDSAMCEATMDALSTSPDAGAKAAPSDDDILTMGPSELRAECHRQGIDPDKVANEIDAATARALLSALSTAQMLDEVVQRLKYDGPDTDSLTLGELKRAIGPSPLPAETLAQPPEWLWWGEVDGKDVVTFGRWPKRGARYRYKLAEIQPTEHDHAAPSKEREALERQCDNMAFILNRIDIGDNWHDKFTKELAEDRQAIASEGNETQSSDGEACRASSEASLQRNVDREPSSSEAILSGHAEFTPVTIGTGTKQRSVMTNAERGEPVAFVPLSKAQGCIGEPMWAETVPAKYMPSNRWPNYQFTALYATLPADLRGEVIEECARKIIQISKLADQFRCAFGLELAAAIRALPSDAVKVGEHKS